MARQVRANYDFEAQPSSGELTIRVRIGAHFRCLIALFTHYTHTSGKRDLGRHSRREQMSFASQQNASFLEC